MKQMMRRLFPFAIIFGILLAACNPAQPSINIEETAFSLGDVVNGQVVSKDLEVWNSGNGPLLIEAVSTSCGCTTATVESTTLAPGEKTNLHIEFDSGAHGPESIGDVTRQIFISSNDPVESDLRIEFSAHVLPANPAQD